MRKVFTLLLCFSLIVGSFCFASAATSYRFDAVSSDRAVCPGLLPSGFYVGYADLHSGVVVRIEEPVWVSVDSSGGSTNELQMNFVYYLNGEYYGESVGRLFVSYDPAADCTYISAIGVEMRPGVSFISMTPYASVDSDSLKTDLGLITGFFKQFSVDTVIVVIAGALGVSVGLVLLWYAFRFIKRKLSVALKRGKI